MMAITTRDTGVINFLEETRLLMTTKQVSRYFYTNSKTRSQQAPLVVARRRLNVMVKGRYIKRVREFSNKEYIYYVGSKAPKKTEHKLLMSELIITMKEHGFNIMTVEVEYKLLQQDYHIRPDMRVEFEYYGIVFVAFVEVDRTKAFTNEEKYINLLRAKKVDKNVQHALGDRFLLISVCNRKPDMKGVQWIQTDMSNFTKFKYDFDGMMDDILKTIE